MKCNDSIEESGEDRISIKRQSSLSTCADIGNWLQHIDDTV